jgi:hypothetical protein
MSGRQKPLQMIWGVLLFLAGIGMFFTIPEKILEFRARGMDFFGLKFMLYLISVLLIVGGVKKLAEIRKNNPLSGEIKEE